MQKPGAKRRGRPPKAKSLQGDGDTVNTAIEIIKQSDPTPQAKSKSKSKRTGKTTTKRATKKTTGRGSNPVNHSEEPTPGDAVDHGGDSRTQGTSKGQATVLVLSTDHDSGLLYPCSHGIAFELIRN